MENGEWRYYEGNSVKVDGNMYWKNTVAIGKSWNDLMLHGRLTKNSIGKFQSKRTLRLRATSAKASVHDHAGVLRHEQVVRCG